MTKLLPFDVRPVRMLPRDMRGTVLIEAAFALPMLIALLFGILVYGSWFMTAHSLQQAANDAARAAVAGLDTTERRALVDQSVTASRTAFTTSGDPPINVDTDENGGYYTVTLRYDLSGDPFFASSLIPVPSATLQRSAVVRIDAR